MVGRIPLKDVGKIYVSDPNVDRNSKDSIVELEVVSAHPHVHGRTHWQHQAIRAECQAAGNDPDNWADYEAGFLRLIRASMTAMGVKVPGAHPKAKARLTGGQAGRFTGIFLAGYENHALHNLEKDITRYDLLEELGDQITAKTSNDAKVDVTPPSDQLRPASKFRADPLEFDGDDALSKPASSNSSALINDDEVDD